MRTRREQVQAHRFVTRRIVSALLLGEPETTELPMRRLALAVFGSAMIGAIVFAAIGVYGLLRPGGDRPVENALIIERESGAKFLYLRGTLHPVLNYTSALLILAQPKPTVRTMSQQSLKDTPRGRPVGIPDAPDTLPGRNAVLGLPWSVCSARRSPSTVTLATHVFAGRAPAGGSPLADREGLLVSVGSGDSRRLFLLWRDQRLRLRTNGILTALGWAGVDPVPVSEAFLNAVPAGPDLSPGSPEGAGEPGLLVANNKQTIIGQMFRAGTQHYVMLRDGLAPVGEVMARLRLANNRSLFRLSAEDAGRVLGTGRFEPEGFPQDLPELRAAPTESGMTCAVYRGGDGRVVVETFAEPGAELTLDGGAAAAPRQGADGVTTADRVTLPGGHVALVIAVPAPGSSARGSLYLVTDQGIKHQLPTDQADKVQASLGYGGVPPVAVPASILALVPTGPALDPDAAVLLATPATVGPGGPPSATPTSRPSATAIPEPSGQ
jgi:type VII secretion protein EccB